jgi:hypothetical protein
MVIDKVSLYIATDDTTQTVENSCAPHPLASLARTTRVYPRAHVPTGASERARSASGR